MFGTVIDFFGGAAAKKIMIVLLLTSIVALGNRSCSYFEEVGKLRQDIGTLNLQVDIQSVTISTYKKGIEKLKAEAEANAVINAVREGELDELNDRKGRDDIALDELAKREYAKGVSNCIDAFHPQSVGNFLRHGGDIATRSDGVRYTPIELPREDTPEGKKYP